MGKSTISMAIVNSFLYVYQRFTRIKIVDLPIVLMVDFPISLPSGND